MLAMIGIHMADQFGQSSLQVPLRRLNALMPEQRLDMTNVHAELEFERVRQDSWRPAPTVVSVHRSATHSFYKQAHERIALLQGQGVEGDAHCGTLVQHLYSKRKRPQALNLRQVHLLQVELGDELRARGLDFANGALGENIVTRGLALSSLSAGTRLRFGDDAVVEITGLRMSCVKIERSLKGLRQSVTEPLPGGGEVVKNAVMCIVIRGGSVRPEDRIVVEPRPGDRVALAAV